MGSIISNNSKVFSGASFAGEEGEVLHGSSFGRESSAGKVLDATKALLQKFSQEPSKAPHFLQSSSERNLITNNEKGSESIKGVAQKILGNSGRKRSPAESDAYILRKQDGTFIKKRSNRLEVNRRKPAHKNGMLSGGEKRALIVSSKRKKTAPPPQANRGGFIRRFLKWFCG